MTLNDYHKETGEKLFNILKTHVDFKFKHLERINGYLYLVGEFAPGADIDEIYRLID